MNGRYAIETRDLSRRFGARTVLHNVNLQVPEGCIYGFLGPNGAGKTTTIRLLLGLIRPDQGSIHVFGQEFERNLLRHVGALVEMPSVYSHLTGRENLEVTRRQIGAPAMRVDHVLNMVQLTADARRVVREYSLGMKQRLGIALALLNSPNLLILDEPTNGLDPAGIHEMRNLLRRMPSEYGITVFLSSHLLNEVEQIAGIVGIIREGRMIFQGPLGELREEQRNCLKMGVSRSSEAVKFLRARGFDARPDGVTLVSVTGHELEADKVNRLLVESGFEVFQISLQQQSLEEMFLSLTEGRRQ